MRRVTVETIARVVADLRDRRATNLLPDKPEAYEIGLAGIEQAVVVDATLIYEAVRAKESLVWLYDEHKNIAPPWKSAATCYIDSHGGVTVMHSRCEERKPLERTKLWDSDREVDWSRVRWVLTTSYWLGGRNVDGRAFQTCGPWLIHMTAIYDDGSPANIQEYNLQESFALENWSQAGLVLLGTLNFCGCTNVEVVEPQRPRAERKRLERTGVTVKTIHVFPSGKSSRSQGGIPVGGTALHSVRGTFHYYGPQYGKGLLFGKYAGKFWVPPHARGAKEHGEISADYKMRPQSRTDDQSTA